MSQNRQNIILPALSKFGERNTMSTKQENKIAYDSVSELHVHITIPSTTQVVSFS